MIRQLGYWQIFKNEYCKHLILCTKGRLGLRKPSKVESLNVLKFYHPTTFEQIRERSSITSAHWRGVGGLTENADAADASRGGGGSQDKIDDVILEHICWKIPTNNLIYIQLISYSDYSSRWLWSPNLEIKWIIGFSEVSFLSLMLIFVPKNNHKKHRK